MEIAVRSVGGKTVARFQGVHVAANLNHLDNDLAWHRDWKASVKRVVRSRSPGIGPVRDGGVLHEQGTVSGTGEYRIVRHGGFTHVHDVDVVSPLNYHTAHCS